MTLLADLKTYVLKQIDTSKMSMGQKKEAVHEARILAAIDSPFIVKYYDSFTERSTINIIMEYCENGDLGMYMKRQMGRPLGESKIWKFFIEICQGIQYLHANKILHRDIKTINVFLGSGDKVKLGDLGVAKMLN
jgi:NIMA (never in mitosis gene a)-related kinase